MNLNGIAIPFVTRIRKVYSFIYVFTVAAVSFY
eukprot:COSAG05_NODE_17341_length_327_cov_0.622807_2_plen_32_part_01